MNKKALQTLEYDKIIEQLVTYADCPLGKEMARNLRPMNLLEEVREAQQETADALSRIYARGKLAFSGLRDIRPYMLRLDVGGSLCGVESNVGYVIAREGFDAPIDFLGPLGIAMKAYAAEVGFN